MSQSPKLTLGRVAKLTGGEIVRGAPDLVLSEVGTDSRQTLAAQSLFVALCGEHFDGHAFVDQAHAKGAAAALVERADAVSASTLALVVVDDTLEALQTLAAGWRALFDIPVVGITGSNGKTIVKDMLASILAQQRTVFRSPGSYNSQIGVPLSLLGIRAEHEVAIIEAGISRVGEMARLEKMVRPSHGVITNIGLAHAAGLGDLETTAREKLILFERLGDGPLVYPADSAPLAAVDELPGDLTPFGLGEAAEASYQIVDAEQVGDGFAFEMRLASGATHAFTLNAPGRHNLENAAAAIAMADRLGASVEAMRQGLAAFELSPLRLEMHTTQEGITFINDAYSSDPVSARAALSVLEHYAGRQRAIAILGDMLDLGTRSEEAHRQLGHLVARTDIDRLICHGARAETIGQGAIEGGFSAEAVSQVDSLDALHDLLEAELRPGDVVLFKASRTMGLERAAERLLESMAPARLRIDLDAIRANFHAIRRHIGDSCGVMAVVKSFGYGNDATRVAQTLAREGVDALAVAYADEGIPLRRRGLALPILVTNALASEADKLCKYDLTPLVCSMEVVEALAAQARRFGKTVRVHLEIDTGMKRVGLEPERAVDFACRLAAIDEVELEGIMTHLAAADDPGEDDFSRTQIERFEQVLAALEAEGLAPPVVHAANTAATWRLPEAHYDRVRVGLGLYGLAPSEAVAQRARGVRPALSFTTQIIHLEQVAAGESVGYNRSWVADGPRRIATIAAGYNDGFPRFMSNGGEVLVGGRRCPVVGHVCMDVAMVDVTEVAPVEVGDEVVLFGTQGAQTIGVDEIASRGGTISYEILCNISPRVRRIFVRQ
jgi:Alr-MurF fusion protein